VTAPRGQNQAKILAALKRRQPMTASEIAELTGISAATVSTTLTKMAKNGELTKAERGYRLPG
jgi:DNA-binding MarR family transcriptional regulator